MKQLIIIPGLGNWDALYWLTAPWWWLRGYRVWVFSMDWRMNEDVFAPNYARLLQAVRNLKSVYIVGASAGGTAALLALADEPKHIQKIAIIASPVTHISGTQNLSLAAAFKKLKQTNVHAVAGRVFSVYGTTDALVKIHKSQLPGARQLQINSGSHGQTIVRGLTRFSGKMCSFFNE